MNALLVVFAVVGGVAVLGALVLGFVLVLRGRSSGGGGAKAGSSKDRGGAKAARGDEDDEFDARLEELNQEAAPRISPDARLKTAALERDFKQAVRNLRGSDVGRNALTSLPLYMAIGPSASGKTQLLLGSRVFRPENLTKGSGPTLNCVWWLSKQAVVLDTAGRWSEKSSPVFRKFLQLVKEERRGVRALNGLIVVLPANELVAYARDSKSAQRLDALCAELRERVSEVISGVGFEIPVYLVISKCDRLGGFEHLFSPFRNNERERAKVWGFTVPDTLLRADGPGDIQASCDDGLRELGQQIERYTIKRLGQEWSRFEDRGTQPVEDRETADVTALCGFLPRFQDLLSGVREVTDKLLAGSIQTPMLRGVYFTSSTQTESSVFDELYDQILSGSPGDAPVHGRPTDRPKADPIRKGAQPFFVGTLMRNVLEGDAGLAFENPEAEERRARRLRRYTLGVGAIGAVLAAVMGTLWFRASSQLEALDKAVVAVRGAYVQGSLQRSFADAEELAALTRSVAGGTRIGVSNDARVQLAMTYRVFLLDPIFQKLRDPEWASTEDDACLIIGGLGREDARKGEPKDAEQATRRLEAVWKQRARATDADAAVLRAGAELYRAVARDDAEGTVWMVLNAGDVDACCATKRSHGARPEDQLDKGFFNELPRGIVSDYKLPLKYTVEERTKFKALLAATVKESKRQIAGCSADVDPNEKGVEAAYEGRYRQAWKLFLAGLHWSFPASLTPAEFSARLGELHKRLAPLLEDAPGADPGVEGLANKVPGAGKALDAMETVRTARDAPEIRSFRNLPDTIKTASASLTSLLAEIEIQGKSDQPDEMKLSQAADGGRSLDLKILSQPFEADAVTARLSATSGKHHAENAQVAWCAFRNNAQLDLFPFDQEGADADPKEVQAWLDAFDPQAFAPALAEASRKKLDDAKAHLAAARSQLGGRLDGAIGANRTIPITLENPEPPRLASIVLSWDDAKVECKGRCNPEVARQVMPLPVTKISFQLQDLGGNPVRLSGWTGAYSLDRIVRAAGEKQRIPVTVGGVVVHLRMRLGDSEAGFWPFWSSLRQFVSDVRSVKAVNCPAAPPKK